MPSPQGIFIGKTVEELDAIIAAATDRILYGDRVGISGGQKSSSFNFAISPQDVLFEANYAKALIVGPQRVSRVNNSVTFSCRPGSFSVGA